MARLLGSAWQGGGGLNGLAAMFWEPGRAQVALAVDEAIDGDFRASAASTVEAVGIGVATGVAIRELGAAAVDAVRSVPPGPTVKSGSAGGPTADRDFQKVLGTRHSPRILRRHACTVVNRELVLRLTMLRRAQEEGIAPATMLSSRARIAMHPRGPAIFRRRRPQGIKDHGRRLTGRRSEGEHE